MAKIKKMKKKSVKRRVDADGNPIERKKKVSKKRKKQASLDLAESRPKKKKKVKKSPVVAKVAKAVKKASKRGTFWPKSGVKVAHKDVDGMSFKVFEASFGKETQNFSKRADANGWVKLMRDQYRAANVGSGMRSKAKDCVTLYRKRMKDIVIGRYGESLNEKAHKIASRVALDLAALAKEI